MYYISQLLLIALITTLQGCMNRAGILPQIGSFTQSQAHQQTTEEDDDIKNTGVEDLKTCFVTVEDAECDLCIREIIKLLQELNGVHDVIVKSKNDTIGAQFKLFYLASKHLTTKQIKEQLTDYTVSTSSLDESPNF